MKNRKIKILGYGICLIIGAGLLIFLFILLGQHKWLADVLRELFDYLMVGLSAAVIMIYIKPKQQKTISLGLIVIILCLLVIPFFNASIFSGKNGLSNKVETLELFYIAWACVCANWA